MSASSALREMLTQSTAFTSAGQSETATAAAAMLDHLPTATTTYALLLIALAMLSLSLHTTASGARAVQKAMKRSDDAHDALLESTRFRVLRRGMLILDVARDVARHPIESLGSRRRYSLERTRIIKSEGDGLTSLHMQPSSRGDGGTSHRRALSTASSAGATDAPEHRGLSPDEARWVEALANVEMLSELEVPHLESLAQLCHQRLVRAGERLHHHPVAQPALSVVLEGELQLLPGESLWPGTKVREPLRSFAPGARCSSFLELLAALTAPAIRLPVIGVAVNLEAQPRAASSTYLAAGTDSVVLELQADAIRQLGRQLRNGLAEMILLRFASVTCGALAFSYLDLPPSLTPRPTLPHPLPPQSGGWHGRGGYSASAGSHDGAANALPTPPGKGIELHVDKWLKSALQLPPSESLDAKLHHLAPGDRIHPAQLPPAIFILLHGRVDMHTGTGSDGAPVGGRDSGRAAADETEPTASGSDLGAEAELGGGEPAASSGRFEHTLSAGEILGFHSVFTSQPAQQVLVCQPRRQAARDGSAIAALETLVNRGAAAAAASSSSSTADEAGALLVSITAATLQSLWRRRPELMLRLAALELEKIPPLLWMLDQCVVWSQVKAGRQLAQITEPAVHVLLCGRMQLSRDVTTARAVGDAPPPHRPGRSARDHAASNARRSYDHLLGPGDSFGEAQVLLGSRLRYGRVKAVRDTQLLTLPGSVVSGAARVHASLPLALGRRLAKHYVEPSLAAPLLPSPTSQRTVTLLPLGSDFELNGALDYTCAALHAALGSMRVRNRLLSSRSLLSEFGAQIFTPFGELKLSSWLASLETRHDLLLFRADPFPSEWTRRCLRQADLVLLVGLADASPYLADGGAPDALQPIEELLEHSSAPSERELILLHRDPQKRPTGTRMWLARRPAIRDHHHLRLHIACPSFDSYNYLSDVHRLARSLAGWSFGVVLGGGGARGLAHLGVLRALRDAGIPVDKLGGTSQGAFMSAVWALNDDPYDDIRSMSEIRRIVRTFASSMSSVWLKIKDLTIPVTSYFSGDSFNEGIVNAVGDAKFEDAPIPIFACSTDLYTSHGFVHRNGAVWRYVRASMSLSGYLPPLCDAIRDPSTGRQVVHLLCDGGYVNNLPADVMRQELRADIVIAVDVSSDVPIVSDDYGASLRGSWILLRRLRRFFFGAAPEVNVPGMAHIASQLAYVSSEWQRDEVVREQIDLYLKPPVQAFGLLEYESLKRIQDIGYEHATAAVERWKAQLRERDDPRCVIFDELALQTRRSGVGRDDVEGSSAADLGGLGLYGSVDDTGRSPGARGRHSTSAGVGSHHLRKRNAQHFVSQ